MAQEEIKYTLPSQVGGAQNGRQVDLIVTYDPTMRNRDGSYTVTSATGTYAIVNDSGAVTSVDTITGLVPAGTGGLGANDDELFLSSDPSTTPIVDYHGITYSISNPADSNITTSTDARYGQVNFFDRNSNQSVTSAPTDTPYYLEAGENHFELTVTACFASGTMICTNEGNVSVENLMIGQFALTAFGVYRPIRWLGHRVMDCHSDPAATQPVRICAHAFGQSRPARDLLVSPGHAICVDVLGEVLIPAAALVNGSTIQQVEVDEVTYWHVELDSHDIILAENLPAESYLDMGNRGFFKETDVIDLAAGPDGVPSQRTHADFCRPFVDGGPILDAVKAQLRRRAESLGWAHSDALEMHLVVDGQRLDPVVRGLTARFEVPADAKDVWLLSPTARPCNVFGTSDGRELGLFISALRIDDGFDVRDVAIDDPLLCIGFHAVEDGARRWTSGRARLPAALWQGCEESFYLRVELAGMPLPRWIAPAAEAVAAERPRLSVVA